MALKVIEVLRLSDGVMVVGPKAVCTYCVDAAIQEYQELEVEEYSVMKIPIVTGRSYSCDILVASSEIAAKIEAVLEVNRRWKFGDVSVLHIKNKRAEGVKRIIESI